MRFKVLFQFFIVIVGLATLSVVRADETETYTTWWVGAKFTRVQAPQGFGDAWKDPSGAIWSAYQGEFANGSDQVDANGMVLQSGAAEACAKLGARLPTAEDYQQLSSYFAQHSNGMFMVQGQNDLYAVFPDMKEKWFWTSSAVTKYHENAFKFTHAYIFTGEVGDVHLDYPVYRGIEKAVRCVIKP